MSAQRRRIDLLSSIVGLSLLFAPSMAGAQESPPDEALDVPTAADSAVLAESPLIEEAAPPIVTPPEPAAAELEASALDGEDIGPVDEQGPVPGEPQPPVYEMWWFWTSIGALVIGITLSIVIGVTTEHPSSSTRSGLVLRF